MAITKSQQAVIDRAFRILDKQIKEESTPLTSPHLVRRYLRLALEGKESECFSIIFLDTQHRVIEYREMFNGTIDGAAVYPREVVKAALELNSAAILLSHNHPSGHPEPSEADRVITNRLKSALELIDVRVLDHFIVAGGEIRSFAEMNLL